MTVDLAALPPTPTDADPIIIPGLLTGLGITRRPVPHWITNPDLIELDDTFLGEINA